MRRQHMDPARWLRRRHNVFHSPLGKPIPDAYRVQVARWLLRLLGTASVETDESESPHILEMVGLAHLKLKNLRHPTVIHAFTTRLAELEHQPLDRTGTLYRNIDHISDLIGLSEVEKEVLAFVVLHQTCSALRDCVEALNGQSSASVCDLLALVLGVEQTKMRTVLRAEGPLCASGILRVDHTETDMNEMLSLINGLEAALLDEPTDGSHLFRQYFKPATPPQLGIDRFSHLKDDIAVLRRILTAARQQDTQGVNILIYGVTGTGKTAFVRALADSVKAPLFEVGHEMENTNLEEKHFRFRSYLLSQKVLAKNRSHLILFDEVEDVFPDSFDPYFGRTTNSGRYKSWTNTVLETNQRPAFWLCNQAHPKSATQLHLRMFDFHKPMQRKDCFSNRLHGGFLRYQRAC